MVGGSTTGASGTGLGWPRRETGQAAIPRAAPDSGLGWPVGMREHRALSGARADATGAGEDALGGHAQQWDRTPGSGPERAGPAVYAGTGGGTFAGLQKGRRGLAVTGQPARHGGVAASGVRRGAEEEALIVMRTGDEEDGVEAGDQERAAGPIGDDDGMSAAGQVGSGIGCRRSGLGWPGSGHGGIGSPGRQDMMGRASAVSAGTATLATGPVQAPLAHLVSSAAVAYRREVGLGWPGRLAAGGQGPAGGGRRRESWPRRGVDSESHDVAGGEEITAGRVRAPDIGVRPGQDQVEGAPAEYDVHLVTGQTLRAGAPGISSGERAPAWPGTPLPERTASPADAPAAPAMPRQPPVTGGPIGPDTPTWPVEKAGQGPAGLSGPTSAAEPPDVTTELQHATSERARGLPADSVSRETLPPGPIGGARETRLPGGDQVAPSPSETATLGTADSGHDETASKVGSPAAGAGGAPVPERIESGSVSRLIPRHGRPLGWLPAGPGEYAAKEGEPGDRDRYRHQGLAPPPPGEQSIPGGRAFAGRPGPMIAGTYPGALRATGESEDEVAIPAAPDTSADTPIARAAQAAMNARTGREPWPRPRRCRIMTIANQKGGVGKTTSAVNLAASLAMHGSRVLVVDLDPQGNASTALDVEHRSGTPSIYSVLVEALPLSEVVRQVHGFSNLYCAPATIDLAGSEIELVPLVARESRLSRAVQEYDASELDYIFIDCPPSLGLLTVNALVAAPEVLIPIQCEYYALEGLEQLLRTVDLVKSHLNPGLKVSTILLTMFDSRTRLASQVADEVRGHFGELVLSSVIPRSVRVSEAPSYGQSVMTYDPGSSGALAYLEAAREMAFRNTQAATA